MDVWLWTQLLYLSPVCNWKGKSLLNFFLEKVISSVDQFVWHCSINVIRSGEQIFCTVQVNTLTAGTANNVIQSAGPWICRPDGGVHEYCNIFKELDGWLVYIILVKGHSVITDLITSLFWHFTSQCLRSNSLHYTWKLLSFYIL